ncbi:glycoside hydrolase family 28 protein [Aplosporella prunicola CBS 121167]|uniref:Glycoside hydrolase family 28 protein n=1 Tax=Aplosporella prunicola CBS 121167 TaxID=1176127 RepID=A0A6A6B9I4_9PEZI|nr:glycoside hydrolase family 28 protein [Aplosporella prunicola CBS 121167]KAF2139577.1 glycoside hydrolase family 28 protein [Aplosporella prunicola CBS 121167]
MHVRSQFPAFLNIVISILFLFLFTATACESEEKKECIVQPGEYGSDDAVAIKSAFDECGHGGKVVFLNETYNINSVMNTTGLEDCEIELRGTLLWSTDISYWLNNSISIGYQNQTTAWVFGGRKIHWQGFGYGTFDGNGQVWYDFVNGTSNYPRRPQQLLIWETYDSVFEGIRFVQSQMWTMTITKSNSVLLQDIYVNSTSNNSAPTQNTDGVDTIYASNITFNRWHVINGDDAISSKANSSDIFVNDCIFEDGQGIAIGSIGQYNGVYEFIENFHVRNITLKNTSYVKTWTGVQKGYPPNGGGGGIGCMYDVQHISTRGNLGIDQCTSYNGQEGDCDTSEFQISDLYWGNISGTTKSEYAAELQCSAEAPCPGVEITNVTLTEVETGTSVDSYQCSNVEDPVGFVCDD